MVTDETVSFNVEKEKMQEQEKFWKKFTKH